MTLATSFPGAVKGAALALLMSLLLAPSMSGLAGMEGTWGAPDPLPGGGDPSGGAGDGTDGGGATAAEAPAGTGSRATADLRVSSWNDPQNNDIIANRTHVLNITIGNLDLAESATAQVTCDIRNATDWSAEVVGGQGSTDLDPGETSFYQFVWTPSEIGDYTLEARVTNPDGDPNGLNDFINITVEVKNYHDMGITDFYPADGMWVPQNPVAPEVEITNLGSYAATGDFDVTVTAVNASFIGPPDFYSDTRTVSAADVQDPNDSHPVTFLDFTPPYEGRFLFNVTFSYLNDFVPANNVTQATVFFTDSVAMGVFVEAPAEKYGEPGGAAVRHTFRIYNVGGKTERFSWTATSGHAWIVGFNPSSGTTGQLQVGKFQEVSIDVAVPAGTSAAENDRLRLKAWSVSYPAANHTNQTYTNTFVKRGVNVTGPADRYVYPGDVFNLSYWVRNTGNIAEVFDVDAVLGDPDSGWKLELKDPASGQTRILDPLDIQLVRVMVTVPEFDWERREEQRTCVDSPPVDITVRATAENGPSGSATASVLMNLILTASLVPDPERMDIPYMDTATPYDFNVTVKNIGNYVQMPSIGGWEHFALNVTGIKFSSDLKNATEVQVWDANVSDPSVNLTFGEEQVIRLRALAPAYPLHGTAAVTMKAEPLGLGLLPGLNVTSRETVHLDVDQKAGVDLSTVKSDGKNPEDKDSDGTPDWRQAKPGRNYQLQLNISNEGNGLDAFNVTVKLGNKAWDHAIRLDGNSTRTLQPRRLNESDASHFTLFNVTLFVPVKTPVGEKCVVTVNASSYYNASVYSLVKVTVVCGRGYLVDLEPEENGTIILPGHSRTFKVRATNMGNVVDTIGIAWNHPGLPGWTVAVNHTSVTLDPYNSTVINVTVMAEPDVATDAFLRINVTGTSFGDPREFDRVNITVAAGEIIDVRFTPRITDELAGRPGDSVIFDVWAENLGNVNASVRFDADTLYPDWRVRLNLTTVRLLPGDGRHIQVNVTIRSLVDMPDYEWLAETGTLSGTINNVTVNATTQDTEEEVGSMWTPLLVLPLRRNTAFFELEGDPGLFVPCEAGGTIVRRSSGTRDDGAADGLDTGVLVSETTGGTSPDVPVEYPLRVVNTGNGPDVVQLSVNGSVRYLPWATLGETDFSLEVGEAGASTLTVSPMTASMPYWHEEAQIRVMPRSIHGEFGVPATSYTRIESVSATNGRIQVLMGDTVQFNVTMVNVPLKGDNVSTGFPLAETAIITTAILNGRSGGDGWLLLTPSNFTETFTTAYEKHDIAIRLKGTTSSDPDELEALLQVTASSALVPTKTDSVHVEALAYYTDFWVGSTDIGWSHPTEGDDVEVRVRVHADSNVINVHVWARVFAGGEQVAQELLVLNTTAGQYLITFNYTAEELHWARKQAEVPITVEIDREDRIRESKPGEGMEAAEENNHLEVTMLVRDAGLSSITGLGLVILALVIIVGLFILIGDRYEPYVGLNIMLALTGAVLFSLPWYSMGDNVPAMEETHNVNMVGWSIIGIVVLLMAVVTFFASRDCMRAYVVNRMDRETRGAIEEEEGEEGAGGEKKERPSSRPSRSSFWRGGDDDAPVEVEELEEDEGGVVFETIYLPVLIGFLTAALAFPSLIFGVSYIHASTSGDTSALVGYQLSTYGQLGPWQMPNLLTTGLIVAVFAAATFYQWYYQRMVWRRLREVEDTLRAIKEDMKFNLDEEEPAEGRLSRGRDGGRLRDEDGEYDRRARRRSSGRRGERPPGRREPRRERRLRYPEDRDGRPRRGDRYDGRDRYERRDRGGGRDRAGGRDRRGGRDRDRGRRERGPPRDRRDSYDRGDRPDRRGGRDRYDRRGGEDRYDRRGRENRRGGEDRYDRRGREPPRGRGRPPGDRYDRYDGEEDW